MALELITIDFWNTLFNAKSADIRNYIRLKVLTDTLNDLGITINEKQFDIVLQKSWEYYTNKWINEVRTPSSSEILTFIWKEMNFADNKKAFEYILDFFENMILLFPPKLEPNVNEALNILSSKYKLGIVSDTGFSPGRIVDKLLIELDIIKHFSAFSYSDQTGVSKPHPKAFTTILEQLNIRPDNAIHIGDIDRTDIIGAKNVGMKTIRYDGCIDKELLYLQEQNSQADYITDNWKDIVRYLMETN